MGEGSVAQWLAYLLPDPAALGSIPSNTKKFSEEIFHDNQWCCLEESGHWLDNVDQTHLVLGSAKLVLQKTAIAKDVSTRHVVKKLI